MSEVLFSIGEASRRTGISTDVIRAWERRYGLLAPRRSESNFRLYSPDDIARLRLMRLYTEQNIPRGQAAELVRRAYSTAFDANPGIPDAEIASALASLRMSLERFDAAPADRLLQGLALVFPPGVILRDVVLPYLRELGERWAGGRASVEQEHFASSFLESWMLGTARGWTRSGRRRAVLACIPGEQHVLGLIAFGIALRDLGWSITFLGRDTPLAAARNASAAANADALVLAASLRATLAAAADEVAGFADEQPVLIGGPATARGAPGIPATRVLPADLLVAARILTTHVAELESAAAQPPQRSRGGGSGTASTSRGAA